MSEEDIKQLRSNVTDNVSRMPSRLMYRNYNFPDYESDERSLGQLSEVLDQLEQVFSLGPEMAEKVLGGEFKSNSAYDYGVKPIPLFLHLDTMVVAIDFNMRSTERLNDRKKELKARIAAIREKAAKLSHNPIFDPSKELSYIAQERIASSKGNFSFDIKEIEGRRYLSVAATSTYETYDYRHGDIYNLQSSTSYSNELAYKEDQEEVERMAREKKEAQLNEIRSHISKYFKDGVIPSSMAEYFQVMKDTELPKNITTWLFTIMEYLTHSARGDSFSLEDAYKYLKENEAALQKQQEEERKKEEEARAKEQAAQPPRKKGFFERFRGRHDSQKETISEEEAEDRFEKARRRQIVQDEEIRDVVIYQRTVVNGKEVLVPLDNSEYKVVRR